MTLTNDTLTETKSEVIDFLESIFLFCNIGEDGTASVATDTELGSEILRVPIIAVDKSVADKITVSAEVLATQGNGSIIREVGLVDEASVLIDGCDTITGWTDSTDMTISLNNTTYWEGNGSINLTKDGVTVVGASTSKTVTSTDFTDSSISFILNILDATALSKLATSSCLNIRYGSDSSNYYEWNYDVADLDTGKILINNLTSANADSTTGTPVSTAMDYFYIELVADASATVWSDGDFIIDNIQVYDGTQYERSVVIAIGKTDAIVLYIDTTTTTTVTQS